MFFFLKWRIFHADFCMEIFMVLETNIQPSMNERKRYRVQICEGREAPSKNDEIRRCLYELVECVCNDSLKNPL